MKERLKNCSVAVLGLGKSGISSVKLLKRLGAKVFVSDLEPSKKYLKIIKKNKFAYECGKHSKKILDCNLIVVSPGIDWNLPLLCEARFHRIPVIGELELGFRYLHSKTIVAVTGTNGKTTTVSLLGEIFKRSGGKTLVAGNLGFPLTRFVSNKIPYDIVDLEVSSYQLEGIDQFHPQVSVLLNLTNDHLKRHKTMKNYAKIKERIFKNQNSKDFTILNWDDTWCRSMAKNSTAKIVWFSTSKLKSGVWWDKDLKKIVTKLGTEQYLFSPPPNLYGLHNIENSCAAIAAALCVRISKNVIQEGLTNFKSVEHRLEFVAKIHGVTYMNDSKATNVDSTLKALDSFEAPLWVILGGQDKGGSYEPLRSFIQKYSLSKKVKGIALIGEAAQKISLTLKGSCEIIHSGTLNKAVLELSQKAKSGEIVLLSPACASFDQFKNFEDRGRQFKKFVRKIDGK